jgi:hypothetical protein
MAIWYILWPFGIFYGHLVYFMAIWYILWSFGIFDSHFVYLMAIWYIKWPFCIFDGHLVYFCPFGIFYGHLVYFMAIWYILCPFGIFYIWSFGVMWCTFPRFGILYQENLAALVEKPVSRKLWKAELKQRLSSSSRSVIFVTG